MREHSEGLIGLSACLNGEVSANVLAGRIEQAEKAASEYQDIFGKDRFFLEIHDHGLEKQRKIIPDMLRIGERTGIQVAATNDCHYMQQDDCRAHDILLCIQTGKTVNDPNRMKFYTDQFYFKTRQEMDRVFGEIPSRSRSDRGDRRTLQSEAAEGRRIRFRNSSFRRDSRSIPILRKLSATDTRIGSTYLKPLADRGALKNDLPLTRRGWNRRSG